MTTLACNFLGIDLENPFLLASASPTASIASIAQGFDLGWAGAVLKTITPPDLVMEESSPRYAFWRENQHCFAMQNVELLSHLSLADWITGIKYLKEKFPTKVIIASIMAQVEEKAWQNLVQTLEAAPIDAYELNFSCPHGMPEQHMGMAIGTHAQISAQITRWVKASTKKPVIVKLTHNVADITEIGLAVEQAGADAWAAINTVQGFLGIDLDSLKPVLDVDGKTAFGGISGPIIKPLGLRCVAQLRQVSSLPIMGIGGISTWEDTVQYLAAGADVVQICTAVMLRGLGIIQELKRGLSAYLDRKNFTSINDLKNIALKSITTHDALPRQKKYLPQIDHQRCTRCSRCVLVCQESEGQALRKQGQQIVVDAAHCLGCGLCAGACPVQAIKLG